MSNFAGHRNAGIAVASINAIGLLVTRDMFFDISYQEIVLSSSIIFIFSLFPDIDVKSTPSKFFYTVIAIFLGHCYYTKQHEVGNLVGLLSILPQMTKHRGIFHHPLTALLLPASVFYLYYTQVMNIRLTIIIYISSVIGYFVHLIKDMK